MNDYVPVCSYLFERNYFSFIKLLENLSFPDIYAHYIFLKLAEENKTNNHKKGLILSLVCVSYKKHLYFERNSNE